MTKAAAASAGQDVLARLQQAEDELAALRRELDHSHQLATLGTLTAGIAHEINNILTPVLAYAQLARANPQDLALAKKALQRAIAGVKSASRITEAVLGFARNDDEDPHANVMDVIESSLACLGRDPSRDGVNLVTRVPAEAQVSIPPLALQQVLLNLILNALNALHGQPGELRIVATESGGGMTLLEVSDNGPGIPERVAERLFEPFVSGHDRKTGKPTPTGRGGSGLGLAVCKRLIETSGGTITLAPESIRTASTPANGATFQITIPTYGTNGGKKAA